MMQAKIRMPAPKGHTRRLADWMRRIQPSHETGYRLDRPTAAALVMYGRTRGWKMVQKREGNSVIVWRAE